jgi:hypothetical protein
MDMPEDFKRNLPPMFHNPMFMPPMPGLAGMPGMPGMTGMPGMMPGFPHGVPFGRPS